MRHLLRWYGAGPLHLLSLLACFALAGYAAIQLVHSRPLGVAVWFLGAVIGHDLLLMPLYSLADRSVVAVIRHRAPGLPALPWINYVRVPAALSGLLLLVWFPLILRLTASYHASTTLSPEPYLWHWLAVTGVLFLLSAVAFAARLRGTSQHTPPPDAGREARAAHRADPVPPADGAGQARSATIRAPAWPAAEEIRADPAPGEEPEHPVTGAGLARPAGGESQARPAHEATGTHPAEEQGEAARGAVAEDGDGHG